MRDAERGFTLIEMVVTVSIVAILVLAGGLWMMSMRPAALSHAVDEYDAALAQARALAAGSGNGATMVFAPATHGGFTIRLYSGRPDAVNAVKVTNAMAVVSDASVREATFGPPPFALFFSSAGYPTGKASYPSIDASGHASFPVIAQQPPCPANGITLVFTGAQGATATRTLACTVGVTGRSAPNPAPTGNSVRVSPASMVAHWTTDTNGALRFVVAEFGYTHWFAKGTTACDALVTFKGPNPYGAPANSGEAALAPSAPANTPISYPSTAIDPDEPRAPFELLPISGAPGECTMTIVDDASGSAQTHVQVMGDLTPSATSLTFASPTAPAQTVTFTKTWDSEALLLSAGGACGGVVTASVRRGSTPGAPGSTPASATVTITPVNGNGGRCTLVVGDQYGEPHVDIAINVKNQPFATWPESLTLGVSNSPIAFAPRASRWDYLAFVNAVLGGATADAAATSGCFAQATLADGKTADPISTLPQFVQQWATGEGINTDPTGCFTSDAAGTTPIAANNGNVGVIAYEPSQKTATFQIGGADTCGANTIEGPWLPLSAQGTTTLLHIRPGSEGASCTVAVTDNSSGTLSLDHGLANVTVLSDPCKVNGNVCMSVGQVWHSDDVNGAAGGPVDQCGSCTDTVSDSSLWHIYLSSNGGSTWTYLGDTLTSSKIVTRYMLGRILTHTSQDEQEDSGANCTTNGTYRVYNGSRLDTQQTVHGNCSGSVELSESTYKYDAWESDNYLVLPRSGTNWQTSAPPSLTGATLPLIATYYSPVPVN